MKNRIIMILFLITLIPGLEGVYAQTQSDIVINEIKYSSQYNDAPLEDKDVHVCGLNYQEIGNSPISVEYNHRGWLTDGMLTSHWYSNTNNATIDFELPVSTSLTELHVFSGNIPVRDSVNMRTFQNDGMEGRPKRWELYVADSYDINYGSNATAFDRSSNDATFGTKVASGTFANDNEGQFSVDLSQAGTFADRTVLTANPKGKFVRLKILDTWNGDLVILKEINFTMGRRQYGEFVELYNKGNAAVDVSNWRLSGEVDFTIPANTTIAQNGYLVIAASETVTNQLTTTLQEIVTLTDESAYPAGTLFWRDGQKLSSKGNIKLRDAADVEVCKVDYKLGFPWPVAKGNGASIELIHPDLDPGVGSNWRSSIDYSAPAPFAYPAPSDWYGEPTPGAINLVYDAADKPTKFKNLKFKIYNANGEAVSGNEPTAADSVKISIEVDDADGIAANGVKLHYQVVDIETVFANQEGGYIRTANPIFTAWYDKTLTGVGYDATDLTMTLVSNNVYEVTLDGICESQDIVRYRISVKDSNDNQTAVPYRDDKGRNFAYHCYDGVPDYTADSGTVYPGAALETLPVYHLYSQADPMGGNRNEQKAPYYQQTSKPGWAGISNTALDLRNRTDYFSMGTLVYDGKVYDHIRFRPRGETSGMVLLVKNKFKVRFNAAHPFEARDMYGKKYKEPWSKINFMTGNTNFGNLDKSTSASDGILGAFLFEPVAFKLYELAGLPVPDVHLVHMRSNFKWKDQNRTPLGDPYKFEGPFMGIFVAVQQQDDTYIKRNKMGRGNVYSTKFVHIAHSGCRRREAGFDANSDQWRTFTSDLLIDEDNTTKEEIREAINEDNYINWMISNMIVNNCDLRKVANVSFFHNAETGKWEFLPWDLNWTFDTVEKWGGIMEQQCFDKIFDIAEVKQKFNNRARELTSLLYGNGDPLVIANEAYWHLDHGATGTNAVSEADKALWNNHPEMRAGFVGQFNRIAGTSYEYAGPTGMVQYIADFVANETPASKATSLSEFVYRTDDSEAPAKPTGISFIGESDTAGNYLPNQLEFECDAFAGGVTKVQWRIGEVYNENVSDFDPTKRRKYEINASWKSIEMNAANAGKTVSVPPGYIDKNKHYRVRARVMDADGDWSYWSDALEFTTSANKSELYISEVIAHSDKPFVDAIELHNASNSDIDLSGWWLSDKDMDADAFVTTNAWQIPAGTTIAAGDYMTFTEGHGYSGSTVLINDSNEFGNFVKLSSSGDEAILYTVNKFKMDDFKFGGTFVNTSIGLHQNDDDVRVETIFANQTIVNATTGAADGAANGTPLVGDVVITEIMYNPLDEGHNRDFEFLELYNRSGNTVNLYNSTGDPWEVDGIGYTFPSNGVSMPPAGILLLVKEKTSTPNSEFFTKYTLTTNNQLQVIFHDEGKLSDGGETVKLQARDERGLDGNNLGVAAKVTIDRVEYKDTAPWPTDADGVGKSLERTDPSVFGNQSGSWTASTVLGGTPGIVGNLSTPAIGLLITDDDLSVEEGQTIPDETLTVRNSGVGTLNYTITEKSDANNIIQSLSSTTGSLTGNGTQKAHAVRFNSGLSIGTYSATLNVAAGSLTKDITITLEVTASQVVPTLEAYNDLAWDASQSTAANVTKYAIGTVKEPLKDVNSGQFTAITVTINGTYSGTPAIGLHPASGTEAYAVFDGIVDCMGIMGYGNNQELLFEGLDPNEKYEFVFYGDRNNYTNRNTKLIISEAISYNNTSSVGANGATTLQMTGLNNATGHVIRYEEVVPSASGAVTFTVDRPDSSDTYKSYLNAFKVAQTSGSVPSGGYDAWKVTCGFPAGQDTFTSDPDGDGLENLVEYALNTDPTNQLSTAIELKSRSGSTITYRHPQNKTATDVTVELQGKENLTNTSWITLSTSGGGNKDAGTEWRELAVDHTNTNQYFLRIKVTKP